MDSIERTKTFFDKVRPNHAVLSPLEALTFRKICELIPAGAHGRLAVDLGCHWGKYVVHLSTSYGQVIGIDFAPAAIASAIPGNNVTYQQADLENDRWSFDRPVDLFLAVGLFEMLKDPTTVCQRMAANCAPGAQALIVIPNRFHPNYWLFRGILWAARIFARKPRAYVFNNGATKRSVRHWMGIAGFGLNAHGSVVGVPPALGYFLPAQTQRALVRLDRVVSAFLPGAYSWALFVRK